MFLSWISLITIYTVDCQIIRTVTFCFHFFKSHLTAILSGVKVLLEFIIYVHDVFKLLHSFFITKILSGLKGLLVSTNF